MAISSVRGNERVFGENCLTIVDMSSHSLGHSFDHHAHRCIDSVDYHNQSTVNGEC
jgi:hypothetical protein